MFGRKRKADRQADASPTDAPDVEAAQVPNQADSEETGSKAAADHEATTGDDAAVSPDADEIDAEAEDSDSSADDEAEDLDDEDAEAALDEWAQFDLSRDWRDDGPFDIDEVDLSADDVKRVDLGALVVTPEAGMRIKLMADPASKTVLHLIVENAPQSAMQLTLFAVPSDSGEAAHIRQDLIDHTENAQVMEQVKGPFGTELRRVLKASDDQGNEGFVPLRDWLIAGPRWVLNARLMGQAALDSEGKGPAIQLEEFVRNTIVRRGDTAMVPGSVVPLKPRDE
ncbi:MAG: DUF3710 domain-containing protein [Propionibacteriaceae bacterium]|jgi:hypothetical protein|nr:DUF3710 domain-containing protein [Propionibacteriaceae bacterium]